jgi:CHAD domain-containing protein
MAVRLPSDLLERSAQESSRLIALSYLDQIERARKRLTDSRDAEALHDFRVGLRRLRSCTRAYRVQLEGSVTKKMRQRLRKLTRATNTGRDAEVHLAWFRKQSERLGTEDMQGLFWLIGRLEERKHETLDQAAAEVGQQFGKAATKLRQRLGTLQVAIGTGPRKKQATFGQVTGELIQQQTAVLAADLERVREAANVREAHRARISIKRLRYLLEPVARHTPRARGLVTRLKEAQDLLGTLHDMHVLSEEITSSLVILSQNPDRLSGSESGLRTLGRLAQEEAAAAFGSFDRLWGADGASRFLTRVEETAKSLMKAPAKTQDDHHPPPTPTLEQGSILPPNSQRTNVLKSSATTGPGSAITLPMKRRSGTS